MSRKTKAPQLKGEKIFVQIHREILSKCSFRFSIDHNLGLTLNYGSGKARVLLAANMAGVSDFLVLTMRHPNCTGCDLHPAALCLLNGNTFGEVLVTGDELADIAGFAYVSQAYELAQLSGAYIEAERNPAPSVKRKRQPWQPLQTACPILNNLIGGNYDE